MFIFFSILKYMQIDPIYNRCSKSSPVLVNSSCKNGTARGIFQLNDLDCTKRTEKMGGLLIELKVNRQTRRECDFKEEFSAKE